MTHYLILMDAYGNESPIIEVIDEWNNMSKNERESFLNDNSESVGWLLAGVYEAETEQQAVAQAENDSENWMFGCVA